MGRWLIRKWYTCQERMNDARLKLRELGLAEAMLRAEWETQVKEQMKHSARE
jgi:hypothetical protein